MQFIYVTTKREKECQAYAYGGGQNYDVTHAMNCKRGGFIIMRHNNVQDFEAKLLKTTLNDVEVEPKL